MKTRIKQLRTEKNLSQEILAQRLGSTQASLSKIERGISIPDASLVVDLSSLFHVSADYLLFLSEVRCTADSLLEDDMRHMKKYRQYFNTLQKFDYYQQTSLQQFLESITFPGM